MKPMMPGIFFGSARKASSSAFTCSADVPSFHLKQTTCRITPLLTGQARYRGAALDPHNILSRNTREVNTDFQLNVLGEWGRAAALACPDRSRVARTISTCFCAGAAGAGGDGVGRA